jgi:ribosomal subunit interface protein
MMDRKISFHNMPHSDPMERHANEKLNKIEDMLRYPEDTTPFFVEVWLKANKQHPHHRAEIHLKTPNLDLNAHDEGTDMYVSLDNSIDKIVSLIKKEKEKREDKEQKPETEKGEFASDKYPLSE